MRRRDYACTSPARPSGRGLPDLLGNVMTAAHWGSGPMSSVPGQAPRLHGPQLVACLLRSPPCPRSTQPRYSPRFWTGTTPAQRSPGGGRRGPGASALMPFTGSDLADPVKIGGHITLVPCTWIHQTSLPAGKNGGERPARGGSLTYLFCVVGISRCLMAPSRISSQGVAGAWVVPIINGPL